jgi:hypothetical protein
MEGSDRPHVPVGNTMATGRLPNPGNAEFLLYVVANVVGAIVAASSDHVSAGDWFELFKWTTAAYLLSRGIAKASRVFEN